MGGSIIQGAGGLMSGSLFSGGGGGGGRTSHGTDPMYLPQRTMYAFNSFAQLLQPTGPGGMSPLGQFITQATNQQLQLTRQLAPQMQKLQARLIKNDPILGKQQQLAKQALKNQTSLLSQLQQVVSNPNQLDPAMKRMLQDQIRSRYASLGTLDSGGAALTEVTDVARANLNATDQRIGQILAGLGGNAQIAAGGLPTTPGLSNQFNPFANLPIAQGLLSSIPSNISAMAGTQNQMLATQNANQQAMGQGMGQLAAMLAMAMI